MKYLFLFVFFINTFSYAMDNSKDEIFADKITALVFTSDSTIIDTASYEGIQVKGLEIKNISAFQRYFNCFISQPLSYAKLEEIEAQALYYFKNETDYLVDVKILENQDVSSGKIQIFVQIAKVGNIQGYGAKYFSNNKIENGLRISYGQPFDLKQIKRYITFLNKNPFRQVSAIFKPGKEIGFTDIDLYTQDLFPIKVFGGYENTGNEIAGSSRLLVGLNFGNLWRSSHQANIEFKASPSIKKWWGLTGDYTIPLFYENYLKFIASFVKTKPQSEEDYNAKGKAWTILLRYHIPIQVFKSKINEVVLGYDFKQTNNYLSFLKNSIFENYIDISQFVFQLNGSAKDRFGFFSYLFHIYWSPGDITKRNDNSAFRQEGNAKKSNYIYSTLHFDKTFDMPHDFLYVIDFFGQLASTRLLPTEQLSLGGYSSIRGYQENEAYGDNGFYLKNEIRTCKFPSLIDKKVKIQLLAFVDLGYVTEINDNISDKNSTFLASFGPGIRGIAADNFILKLDWGIQLKNFDREFFNKSWHSRLHAFVSCQY